MFGIGTFELVLILIFGFLIFGPDKLPAIAKTVSQALSKFRGAQEEMNKVLKTEVYDPSSDEPFKNPFETMAKVTGADKKEKTESFSERKDRYDKQREAKRKVDERKQAAAEADFGESGTEKPKTETEAKASKPKLSADELYGNKPTSVKTSMKQTAEKAPQEEAQAEDKRPASSKPTGKPATRPAAKKAIQPETEPASSVEEKPAGKPSEKKGE